MYDNQGNQSSPDETFLVVNETLDDLVKSNKHFVEEVVRSFTGSSKHVDKDDLIQEGFIALIEAKKNFSAEKNTKFSTYAYQCIDWRLHKYYRKSCNKKYVVFNEEAEGIESQNNQEDKPERKPGKFIPEKEIPCYEDEIQQKTNIQREFIESAIDKLQDDERLIIRTRFYEEKTLEEIGECLGISKEGVRKKEVKALEKLKFILRKDYIYG